MLEKTELQEDVALLNDEVEDPGVVEEDKKEEIIEDENKEGEEEEKEAEETKEEDEETKEDKETQQFNRPTIKAIKEKYPNLFKDFPQLQNAFFREQEYTRIFPTIEDAKEALQDNNAFSTLRDATLSGNAESIIEAIEKSDKSILVKFSSSFLTSLHKRDQESYIKTITPLFENLSRTAYIEGVKTKDEDLSKAAMLISKFLFGTDEVATGKRTFSEIKDDKPSKVDEERAAFNKERFQSSYRDAESRISKGLKSAISEGLDPNDTLTPYIKSKLIDDIMSSVGESLKSDETHMAAMSSAWARAQRAGFDSASISKIVSAYLARAKQVMPAVRNKLRRDALGETKEASQNRVKLHEEKKTERELPPGGSSGNGRVKETRKIDWSKTSEVDFLNDKITYLEK